MLQIQFIADCHIVVINQHFHRKYTFKIIANTERVSSAIPIVINSMKHLLAFSFDAQKDMNIKYTICLRRLHTKQTLFDKDNLQKKNSSFFYY